jgi:hypothetical protein
LYLVFVGGQMWGIKWKITLLYEMTQPPIQWVTGARSGLEVDHVLPSSAEVNNAWRYTPHPQYIFIAWKLIKHKDNFTFYL